MSIVVIGATGQLGRLILDGLIARGVNPAEILATGRSADRLATLAGLGVATAAVDYSNPSSLDAAFESVDTLMFISGSEAGQRIDQHANIVAAAVRAGISRIVYTSAPHADSSALVLAPEHKATEQMIRDSGIPFTFLRNNWYTENYAAALGVAAETGRYSDSTGGGRVASASRIDFAIAAVEVLTGEGHDGKVYELSGDHAWNGGELAEAMGDVLGEPVEYSALSSEEHRTSLIEAGVDEGTAGFMVALDGNIRDGLLSETSGDLARLIGRPTTPLAEGLRATR